MIRTKLQFWKALDWLTSLLIWMVFITIATPVIGFWSAMVYNVYQWTFKLFQ